MTASEKALLLSVAQERLGTLLNESTRFYNTGQIKLARETRREHVSPLRCAITALGKVATDG